MGSNGRVLIQYKNLSPQDQATFRRWLWLNSAVSVILAAGLVAMALVGSNADQSRTEVAAGAATGHATANVLPNRLSAK
jgi:hypothetical protein